MAQRRKTFFSMGGAENIADPSADEAARLLAISVQRQQLAQQGASDQARMSLEERLALDAGRREDARFAADQAARQQQDALAQRGAGQADRRIGLEAQQQAEAARANRAQEARGAGQDELARMVAQQQGSYQQGELGLRGQELAATTQGQREQRKYQDQQAQRELQARQDSEKQRGRSDQADRQLRADLAREAQKAAEQELATRLGHDEKAALREHGWNQQNADRALAAERSAEGKAGAQSQANAAVNATTDPTTGAGLSFVDLVHEPSYSDRHGDQAVAAVADRMAAALQGSKATNEADLLRAREAIVDQAASDFSKVGESQGGGFAGWQADVFRRALAEFRRIYAVRASALRGAPGPQAPNAPRGYLSPARGE